MNQKWLRDGNFIYELHEFEGRTQNKWGTAFQLYKGGQKEELDGVINLFLAAPDLLAALEDVMKFFGNASWENTKGENFDSQLGKARAAIAKAKQP